MVKLKVIIATESYVVNQGFHLIFNKLRHNKLVDKVTNMQDLLHLLEKESVDIILLSTSLITDFTLNDLVKKFSKKRPQIIAYIPDRHSPEENQNIFIDSLYFHDSKDQVLSKLNNLLENSIGYCSENESSDLSEREKDILKEVALGLTNNEIADKLFISAHTVITHRKKITKKLGIKSVSGLTVYAIINGLIEMEDVSGPSTSSGTA